MKRASKWVRGRIGAKRAAAFAKKLGPKMSRPNECFVRKS